MRSSVGSTALVLGFLLVPAISGFTPAASQDFSITNQADPADVSRRSLLKQLQAWWDVHAFYPRHASRNDEGGLVKLHLVIHPDGNIWKVDVVGSSGSGSLDAAGLSTFRGGFVKAFPAGAPNTELEITLNYVLTHRHDQPAAAGFVPAASRQAFAITNDPVRSPILETMLQRNCTGTVVKEGIRNHPWYGTRSWVQATFFRRPEDGTPWVKFYDGGETLLAPVFQVGKFVQWTGREEHPIRGVVFQYQFTVWPDGGNKLSGNIEAYFYGYPSTGFNTGGTVDLECSTEIVPQISWTALGVKAIQAPPADPP